MIPGHMDKDNTNWSYYWVFKQEVVLTGVVRISHYTRLLALLQYVWFYSRTGRLTNCSLIQRSDSHSRETWGSWVVISAIVGPMTIEAIVYNSWQSVTGDNLWHHRSFEGYCKNIPQGAVRVELWVRQCSGRTLGNAHSGWDSVSRIMIEEVSRPQS